MKKGKALMGKNPKSKEATKDLYRTVKLKETRPQLNKMSPGEGKTTRILLGNAKPKGKVTRPQLDKLASSETRENVPISGRNADASNAKYAYATNPANLKARIKYEKITRTRQFPYRKDFAKGGK